MKTRLQINELVYKHKKLNRETGKLAETFFYISSWLNFSPTVLSDKEALSWETSTHKKHLLLFLKKKTPKKHKNNLVLINVSFVLTHAKKDLRKPQTFQKWATSLISGAPCFSCGFLQDDSLELTAQTNIRLLHCCFSPPDFSDVRACRLAFPSRAASSGQTVSVFTAAAFNTSVPLAGERGRLWISQDVGEPNTGWQSQL